MHSGPQDNKVYKTNYAIEVIKLSNTGPAGAIVFTIYNLKAYHIVLISVGITFYMHMAVNHIETLLNA